MFLALLDIFLIIVLLLKYTIFWFFELYLFIKLIFYYSKKYPIIYFFIIIKMLRSMLKYSFSSG